MGKLSRHSRWLQTEFRLEESVVVDDAGDMIADRIPELKTLSAEEKLVLIRELWDELATQPDSFPPRGDHIRLLEERLEHFRRNPSNVVAWEQVKARILGTR